SRCGRRRGGGGGGWGCGGRRGGGAGRCDGWCGSGGAGGGVRRRGGRGCSGRAGRGRSAGHRRCARRRSNRRTVDVEDKEPTQVTKPVHHNDDLLIGGKGSRQLRVPPVRCAQIVRVVVTCLR